MATTASSSASNAPPLFEQTFAWVQREWADPFVNPAKVYSPVVQLRALVRVIVQGFAEFAELRRQSNN